MKKVNLIWLFLFFLMLLANSAHSESTIIDSALVEHLQEISEKTIQQSQTTTKISVDTISTDTSGLTNIPNPKITPYVGMVELDDVYNVLLTKWILNITPTSDIYYDDLPNHWQGYNTDTYVSLIQENENYTLEINRDETHIYNLSTDGGKSWLTSTEADGVKIETSSKKLYLDTATTRPDSLKDVKPTLSENDLDMLAKQTITYQDGTTTSMNQEIDLTANTKVRFSEDDPTGKTDTPRLILYNAASSQMYTLNLTFPTGLDISDHDDSMDPGPGIADQDIMIMGKPFIVGAQDDLSVTKLVLFGGGEEKTLIAGGNPTIFELDGETHVIQMIAWTGSGSTIKGVFLLDGVSYEKAENSVITVNPIKNSQITFMKIAETKLPSPTGGAPIDTAYATILIGATKLTLENSQEVKKGDDAIPGTDVAFTYSGTKIHKIELSYTPNEDVTAEEGVAYRDPILDAFDFVLTGMTPDVKSISRDKIIVAKNGNKIGLSIPLKDGNTLTVDVLETGTDYFTPKVDGNKLFVSDTQDEVKTTDYVLVSDGEYSNLLQFKSMNDTDNILTFSDIGSGDDIDVAYADCICSGTFQTDCTGTMFIGGTSYDITDIDEDDKTIDIDAYSGAEYTQNIPFISGNGANVTLVTGTPGTNYTKGIITISEVDTTEIEIDGTGVVLEMSATTKLGSDEIDNIEITANEPSTFLSIGDSSTNRGVTSYGTMVEDDADAATVTIWYPDEQAYADVYVMKTGVSPSTLDTPDIETLTWGNTTINFKTGTDGFVEITSDYGLIYLDKPMINISLDIDKQEYMPTEEVTASAQLINTEEYLYKQTIGTVFWQIAYENDTTIISKIDNVQISGGESIDFVQNWRANILEPGDYILTLLYNYTDYYGKNWTTEASKQFNVALVSVNIPTDGTINITDGELTLQIKVGDSTNASVNLIKHLSNPGGTTPSGMTDWNKFVQIEVNDDLEGNLNWAMMTMHYNDSEVSAAGIDENTLKIYYLNETLNEWTACENTGVNVIANYVWANVTHFSHYGSFASSPPPEEENNDLGGGGSYSRTPSPTIQTITCTEDWTCTEWSSCENNRQIRTCTDQNDCGTEENKSAESQACEIEYETPKDISTHGIPDTKKDEEERVITSSDSIAQGDMGPTGLATSGISNYSPNLVSILIVVIAIIVGVFLRTIFISKKEPRRTNKR